MFKPVSLFIGLRYFFSGSGSRLVSFISGLAVTGLVLGVALLITVLSIMNGFEKELRTNIIGLVPHIRLYKQDGIDDWQKLAKRVKEQPGVVSATPFTQVNGMLNYRGQVQPVILHGESQNPKEGNDRLQAFIHWNKAEGISHPLFLAKGVADKLGVATGDRLQMVIPGAESYGNAQSARFALFTVVDVFATGTELDQRLAITRLSVAGDLAGYSGRVGGIQLHIDDVFAARIMKYELQQMLPGGIYLSDWISSYGNLYQAIKMSRELVLLLIFVIVAIAAFNVVSMLVMTVTDKRSAIAILKTLGCRDGEILRIFFTKGSLIGLMGCSIGALLGVLASKYIGKWVAGLEHMTGIQFLNTEVYPVDQLPSLLLWQDVLTVVIVAFALNMIATLYPAWRATRVQPADELRYE
ncbi:lipoprotein-releasing ABC transporter permease subunit [Porticoccaceae bacterium LTM1]|nr:lipoprotein-releasing ABC transporter permease subunit [Porticoccaceae bacterium LTM1]